MLKKLGLKTKVVAFVVCTIIAVICVIAIVAIRIAAGSLEEKMRNSMHLMNHKLTEDTELWISQQKQMALTLSTMDVFLQASRGQNLEGAKRRLQELTANSPMYENIFLADPKGELFLAANDEYIATRDLSSSPIFQQNVEAAQKGQIKLTKEIQSQVPGRALLLLTAPILAKNGKTLGIVGLSLILTEFFNRALKGVVFGKTGYIAIVDLKGIIIHHPKNKYNFKMDIKKWQWGRETIKVKKGHMLYDFEGIDKLMCIDTMPNRGWIIAATITMDDFMSAINKITYSVAIICLAFILIATLVGLLIGNSIVNPIVYIAKTLRNASVQLKSASQQITESGQNLASLSTEQASSTEQTSSSMEEMSSMIQNNLGNAERSNTILNSILQVSEKTSLHMKMLEASMNEIMASNEQVEHLVKVISDIRKKTQIMDTIAFQTKLLSFNASVEAERSGEHGRGFAVVAQEVGNLAQMSGDSAAEIAAIVDNSVNEAEMITKNNRDKVADGQAVLSDIQVLISDTCSAIGELKTSSDQVTEASKDQAQGIKQVSEAMNQVDNSTQKIASIAEESAGASEELSNQSKVLLELVDNMYTIVHGDSKTKDVPNTQNTVI